MEDCKEYQKIKIDGAFHEGKEKNRPSSEALLNLIFSQCSPAHQF